MVAEPIGEPDAFQPNSLFMDSDQFRSVTLFDDKDQRITIESRQETVHGTVKELTEALERIESWMKGWSSKIVEEEEKSGIKAARMDETDLLRIPLKKSDITVKAGINLKTILVERKDPTITISVSINNSPILREKLESWFP